MTNKGARQPLGATGAGLRLGDYALGSPLSKAAARALAVARQESEVDDDWDKPLDCTGLAERMAPPVSVADSVRSVEKPWSGGHPSTFRRKRKHGSGTTCGAHKRCESETATV